MNSADAIEDDEITISVIPPDIDSLTDNEEYDDEQLQNGMLPFDVPGTVEMEIDVDPEDVLGQPPLPDLPTDSTSILIPPVPPTGPPTKEEVDREAYVKATSIFKAAKALNQKWKKNCDLVEPPTVPQYNDELNNLKEELSDLTPREVFEFMLTDDDINYMCEQSMVYAQQNNHLNFRIDSTEMRTFLAIQYFSGYHSLPSERHYWNLDEDLGVPFVLKLCLVIGIWKSNGSFT